MAVPFTTRQRLRSAVAGMATLSALSSCVVGPNYEAPRISLTAFHSTAPDDQETSGVRPRSRHMDAKEKFQQIRYKEIASTILLTAE